MKDTITRIKNNLSLQKFYEVWKILEVTLISFVVPVRGGN